MLRLRCMKTCGTCGEEKEDEMFVKNSRCRGGRAGTCKNCSRIRAKKFYEDNREEVLRKGRERKRDRDKDPEYLQSQSFASLVSTRKLRDRVLAHLGGVCCQCGFSDPRALQIDHVRGGGCRDLRTRSVKTRAMEALATQPGEVFQLLCCNCNWIKRATNKELRHKYDHDAAA